MNNGSFVITLPSNVKNDYKNAANSFRTLLPYNINLNGEWEVALCELSLPISHYNIGNGSEQDRQLVFQVKKEGEIVLLVVTISAGHYASLNELISEINREITQVLTEPYSCNFVIDSITQRCMILLDDSAELSLAFLGRELAYVLGFPVGTTLNFSISGLIIIF